MVFDIKLGQKVIYNQQIHYMFFDHGNDLVEIQSENKNIVLVKIRDLIYRVK
jgi:hypothetical protein